MPASAFATPSPAATMLRQFYERHTGKHGAAAAAAVESAARPVYRRLDPESLKDEKKPADDDAPVRRSTAAWDCAFALSHLFATQGRDISVEDDSAQLEVVPTDITQTIAYLLAERCVQCGDCHIEKAVLLSRGNGSATCRRMPLCGACIRSSRTVGRMIMAQDAVEAQELRGDEASQRYLQEADSIVINDPYLVQYITSSSVLENVTTVRFACIVPDTDLMSISAEAKHLKHLILGGNTVGHPRVLGERIRDAWPQLETLELGTGPMLPWVLTTVLEVAPAALKELRIASQRSRNDQSDAAPMDAAAVTTVLSGAAALPSLERFVIHLGHGFFENAEPAERFTPDMVERLAKSPLLAKVKGVRMHCAFSEASARIVEAFRDNEALEELRIMNVAAAALLGQGGENRVRHPLARPPPNVVALSADAVGLEDDNPETVNDTVRRLSLMHVEAQEGGGFKQIQLLPRFTNLRVLFLRICHDVLTPADVEPLAQLQWLERVVFVGDALTPLRPISTLPRVTDVAIDYTETSDSNSAPAAERLSWIDVNVLTRMKKLQKLTIRGVGDLDVIRPDLFTTASFSLRLLEIVNAKHVGDEVLLAAVRHNRDLECVTLSDLETLTNRGIAALEDLLVLRDLAVLRCERVTERGLIRVAERCRALKTTALEAGASSNYVSSSAINKLAARASIALKFPDVRIGYSLNTTDSVIL